MAITLTNLIPPEKTIGVALASSLSFTLTSTVDDFDIDSVVFKINDVSTELDSAFGVDNKELLCNRSLADLEYGQGYICSIQVETLSENFADTFVFTIEEGNFLNQSPRDYFYYHTTQDLANFIPESQKGRYDRYSNFQQFLNKFGAQVEENNHTIIRHATNSYIQTSNLNDLNILHKVELPGNFDLQTSLLDDGSILYKPPEIYGFSDVTKFSVEPDFDNDLSSFYYKKIPNRVSIVSEVFGSPEILPLTTITELEIVIDYEFSDPSGFVIEIVNGTNFSTLSGIANFEFLTFKLSGKSNFGEDIEEVISIPRNGPLYTTRNWNYIKSIEFYNFPKNFSGSFKMNRFPLTKSVTHDFYEYADIVDVRPMSWGLRTEAGKSFLQSLTDLYRDGINFLRDPSQEIVREYQLYDVDNTTDIELVDFTIDEYYNYLYGVDTEYLYLFNKQEEYPTRLDILKQASADPLTVIDLQADELGLEASSKEIGFRATQMVFHEKVSFYRFKMIKPDNSIVYIADDGTETLNAGWTSVKRQVTNFKSPFIYYNIVEPGDYYLFLEVQYKNGSTDRDIKIVRIYRKPALAKYKLEKFIGSDIPERLFFDFDQRLKIFSNTNNLHTITFHRDNVLVDYTNKTLYFNEEYDEVDVE